MSNTPTPPTPHCHPDSLDSASTPEAFAKREEELGTGTITATDHGSMASCLKVYDLARKKNLTPILGVEAYFRDDNCPILEDYGIEKDPDGTYRSYQKYYHLCLHAKDQEAYEALARELSIADLRSEKHGSENKPIMDWAQLEELGKYDITMSSGCLVGMVQRHLLGDFPRPDIAKAYYERLRNIPRPGNFIVEVFPHVCSHNWDKAVYVTLEGGERIRYWFDKNLRTDKGEMKAIGLANRVAKGAGPFTLVGVMHQRKWHDLEPKKVINVEVVEGFVQNECTPLSPQGDIQIGANFFVRALAREYGDKILISDDSHYAHSEDKIVQDLIIASKSGSGWRFYGNYHRQSGAESWDYFKNVMKIERNEFDSWIDNALEWSEGFKDFKLEYKPTLPTQFYPENTIAHVMELIEKHGRMDWTDEVRVKRLQQEIALLHDNGVIDLLPYFFLGEEILDVYAQKGVPTGPGRGSAAGMYLSYLLGITHVDPLEYDLSVDRFLTLDRIQAGALPDIDMDLPERDTLVDPENGYLVKRFGDHFAQISTGAVLRLKSSIKDVCRAKRGFVLPEIEEICKRLPNPPQGLSDELWVFGYESDDGEQVPGIIDTEPALQEYIEKYPDDWKYVQKFLGIIRSRGRHASGYVISHRPVHEFIPTTTLSGVRVTQYFMKDVERAGAVKIDLLGLNSLADLRDAVSLIQERSDVEIPDFLYIEGRGQVPRSRLIPFEGELHDIWALPQKENVFNDIANGNTETVFQFGTNSAKQWLDKFNHNRPNGRPLLDSILDLAVFTALDRPGPLDAMVGEKDGKGGHNMLVEYANRARGLPATEPVEALYDLIPGTHGVIVFQEDLQYVFQKLTGCSGQEAEQFRRDVAKKKVEEVEAAYNKFIGPATDKIGREQAEKVWAQMKTFGQYGFCKAHAVSYSVIGYACAFLKHYFPLEWWTAVLRNATKEEIANTFWKYVRNNVLLPDINLSGDNWEVQNDKIRAPLGFLKGIGAGASNELNAGRPFSSLEDLCKKIEATKDAKSTETISYNDKGEEVIKRRRGSSALNISVIGTLIAANALDSLFPEGLSTAEKLDMYLEEQRKVQNKKRKARVSDKYIGLDELSSYQLKKSVLPIFSQSLTEALAREWPDNVVPGSNGKGFRFLRDGEEPIWLVEGEGFSALDKSMYEGRLKISVPAYIMDVEKFSYHGNKQAVKITMDIGGEIVTLVRWPDRETNKAKISPGTEEGAICIAVLTRWTDDRPFSIEDIYVVREPLTKKGK